MSQANAGPEIERLIQLLARLPGLGPRSARRAALHLMKKKDSLLEPLARATAEAAEAVTICSVCGNVDTRDPCGICTDQRRDPSILVVVEDVGDLWALERAAATRGRYHVLGGTPMRGSGQRGKSSASRVCSRELTNSGSTSALLRKFAAMQGTMQK